MTDLYEAGDVNQADDTNPADDEADLALADEGVGEGNERGPGGGGTPAAVLAYLAKALADDPEAVVIRTEERRGGLRLNLHVAPDDMGRVIGRRGRTAQAIRTLVNVAGAKDGVQASVDIVDD
ncbi:MAG TPA: KH domain-containing protein [Acidimicrobiales bacterium]|nr:KH domain-containing protein [Acidimicrobiales bacterium]